jgi:DNA-binding XRE family transcriptional regulator
MPYLTGVRERRQQTGVKLAEFAASVGLKRQSLGNVEAGRKPASIEAAYRIAHKLTELGVPTEVAGIVAAD